MKRYFNCERCGKESSAVKSRPLCRFKCIGATAKRPKEVRAAQRRAVKMVGSCELCFNKAGRRVAHHIDHYSNNPSRGADPTNLLVLCVPCHRIMHPELNSAMFAVMEAAE